MFHGTSEIIKKSKIDSDLRDVFLDHNFFINRMLTHRTNYFQFDNPTNKFDEAIICLLDGEEFDYSDKKIEYWFQDKTIGGSLQPHCDYNEFIRHEGMMQNSSWAHEIDKSKIMSPITLATYLEVSDDLVGGELVISEQTWFDIRTPLSLTDEDINMIRNSKLNIYNPVQDEILYFHGSSNYHWINEVIRGTRKSMMINFWRE